MFQIETALQFEPGSEGDARSGTIKRSVFWTHAGNSRLMIYIPKAILWQATSTITSDLRSCGVSNNFPQIPNRPRKGGSLLSSARERLRRRVRLVRWIERVSRRRSRVRRQEIEDGGFPFRFAANSPDSASGETDIQPSVMRSNCFFSEFNSTERLCKHSNPTHILDLERHFAWTGSWPT